MIVSNLQNSQRVEKLHPLFKQLFDYVKSHDLLHEELGTIRLDGDNLIVNNIYPECIPEGQRMMDSLIDLTMKKFGWKKKNTDIEERINVKSNESIYTMRFYRTSMQP